MAAHVRLKNEFTEDEKCHNLMSWLTVALHVCYGDYKSYTAKVQFLMNCLK